MRRKPRGVALRLLLTVLLWAAIFLGGAVIQLAATTEDTSGAGAAILYFLSSQERSACSVSYRWRDRLFLLIPVWGLIWTIRVLLALRLPAVSGLAVSA